MKKRFIFILAIAAAFTFSSCAKKCVCIYYEDGKKIKRTENSDEKWFTKEACDDNKELNKKWDKIPSIVKEGKTVDAEQKCKLQ